MDASDLCKGRLVPDADIGQWNEGDVELARSIEEIRQAAGQYIVQALEPLKAICNASNLIANLCIHAAQDTQQSIAIHRPAQIQSCTCSEPAAFLGELYAEARTLLRLAVISDLITALCIHPHKRRPHTPSLFSAPTNPTSPMPPDPARPAVIVTSLEPRHRPLYPPTPAQAPRSTSSSSSYRIPISRICLGVGALGELGAEGWIRKVVLGECNGLVRKRNNGFLQTGILRDVALATEEWRRP